MIIEYDGGEVEISKGTDFILSRNLKDNPPIEKLFVKNYKQAAVLIKTSCDRQKVIEVYNAIQNAFKRGEKVYKVGD